MPIVTVLMTTCNESKEIFLKSLKSILEQTFKDFKLLIIVDNPNNKEVLNIIKEYSNIEPRITYSINEENLGLPLSLNKGIEIVDTEYIARMDADDISDVTRLEKQVEYANKHPDVDLFGTNIIYMDYQDNVLYKRNQTPTNYKKIKKVIKYVNIFNHPTYFGKTKIFKKYKYRNLKYSQDYDLICRLVESGCVVQNMSEYLLYYRLPLKQSEEKNVRQKITYYCVQKEYLKGNLCDVDIQEKIEYELKNLKKENILKAIKLYDNAFDNLRNKKKIKFCFCMMQSFLLSKYQRKQICNLVKYFFIKKFSID